MKSQWRDRIESDPQILKGKPCVKGSRIPVALILGYLAAERSTKDILDQYPTLVSADIVACLDYARDLAGFEFSGSTVADLVGQDFGRYEGVPDLSTNPRHLNDLGL